MEDAFERAGGIDDEQGCDFLLFHEAEGLGGELA